eukprot:GHVT01090731.1.p1 GENE.GHVT01090731.1~~GHVT01090731.1.p1  ORF type:complete len:166 (+),score=44.21 GHVT01090731.1:70-498(+)
MARFEATEDAKVFTQRAKAAGLKIFVVTFSDEASAKARGQVGGLPLVRRIAGGKIPFEKVYGFFPPYWNRGRKYEELGLALPMSNDKSFHLSQVCSDYSLQLEEIVLVDDDLHNCLASAPFLAASIHVASQFGLDLQHLKVI